MANVMCELPPGQVDQYMPLREMRTPQRHEVYEAAANFLLRHMMRPESTEIQRDFDLLIELEDGRQVGYPCGFSASLREQLASLREEL